MPYPYRFLPPTTEEFKRVAAVLQKVAPGPDPISITHAVLDYEYRVWRPRSIFPIRISESEVDSET